MRVLLAVISISCLVVSPALACKILDNPPVTFARAAKQNSHCVDVYLSYTEKRGKLEATVPRLIIQSANGFGLSAELYTIRSKFREGEAVAYFCLSENALREAKIIIEYWDLTIPEDAWICEQRIELDQLDKLLAASDAEKK